MHNSLKDEYFFKFLELNLPLDHDTYRPGFKIWDADVLHERHLDYGHLWYTNVNTLHGVVNGGNTDRYHLVIDMRPNPGMLKKIYG